jgi:aminoglycoside 6-adenylyltransferase
LFTWHARAGDPGLDTWHEARFFERWADPRAIEALRVAYARYDPDEVKGALAATTDAFELFELETAERRGFGAPPAREPGRALIRAMLAG